MIRVLVLVSAVLALLPSNLEGGGAIVNVASLAGRSSSPLHGCHYSASKALLNSHLAPELGLLRKHSASRDTGRIYLTAAP